MSRYTAFATSDNVKEEREPKILSVGYKYNFKGSQKPDLHNPSYLSSLRENDRSESRRPTWGDIQSVLPGIFWPCYSGKGRAFFRKIYVNVVNSNYVHMSCPKSSKSLVTKPKICLHSRQSGPNWSPIVTAMLPLARTRL